jgi:amino acid permease
MCSATLGAGALSLPYAFSALGIVGGVACLTLVAAASHYSVVLLTSALTRAGARSYEELTVNVFGKAFGVLVELNIIAFCFGSAVAYIVALGDLLHPLTAALLARKTVMTLCWAVIMLPLSLAPSLSALQCASYCRQAWNPRPPGSQTLPSAPDG